MIHSYAKQSVVATKGNYPIKGAGVAVFTKGQKSPNVMTGELVVYDPDTGLTIASGSISTQSKVVVAVGVGKEGHIADTLRPIGDGRDLCGDRFEALVTSPVCGSPQVVDVFFDGTQCRKSYGFNLLLDDYVVRSNNPQNDRAIYPVVVTNPCGSECTCDEASCESLVCKFVDAVNGEGDSDADVRNIAIFQNRDDSHQYRPFKAVRLWDSATGIQTFELSLTKDACGNCSYLTPITGVTVGEGSPVSFTNTTVTVDGDHYTLVSQLPNLINQLNAVLKPKGGYAYVKKGIGGCCDYCIEISTCEGAVVFTTQSGSLEAEDAVNPFSEGFTKGAICPSCDASSSTINPTCGFRIYVDPLDVECLCDFPPNDNIPFTYSRTIEITPTGDWECADFFVKEACAQVLDEGFGFYYKDREHFQNNGGIGRNYRYSNTMRGEIGLPDAYSRSAQAAKTVDCHETYCVYNIVWSHDRKEKFSNALQRTNREMSTVLIPAGDTTTKTAWETYLAQLVNIGACTTQDISC